MITNIIHYQYQIICHIRLANKNNFEKEKRNIPRNIPDVYAKCVYDRVYDNVFNFPIEVCCCRKAAKILRLFLCAPLKVFRLRMTKYGVTQVVAV